MSLHSESGDADALHKRQRDDRLAALSDYEAARELSALLQPINWPPEVRYLTCPVVSPHLAISQLKWLFRKPCLPNADSSQIAELPVIKLSANTSREEKSVEVRRITNDSHPAYGQFGLFATRHLEPGDLILPYMGYVHSSTESEQAQCEVEQKQQNEIVCENHGVEHTRSELNKIYASLKCLNQMQEQLSSTSTVGSWDSSSYDLNLYRDEDMELAIDAAAMGNEARFCNDYRGVPADVNALGPYPKKQWERKSKRSPKTWRVENEADHGPTPEHTSRTPALSIPNAEFKDVWLEWSSNDFASQLDSRDADCIRLGHPDSVQDNFKRLNVGQSKSTEIARDPNSSNKCSRRHRRSKRTGMRGVAIFVLPAGKSGKRKTGIAANQEVLVSYGKGFWAYRAAGSH